MRIHATLLALTGMMAMGAASAAHGPVEAPVPASALVSASTPASARAPVPASARVAPADSGLGARVYARCLGCHALAYDRTGPRHCGLFGRRAGSVPGFDYSAAMKHAGIVWDARTLDRFLTNPAAMVPGTSMTYAGVPERAERAAVIEFLRQAGRSAECAAVK